MYEKNNFYKKLSVYYDKFVDTAVIENYYKEVIGDVENLRILDLGCGTGNLIKEYSSKNKTFGIDASPEMLKIAKEKDKKTEYIVGDIKKFNFKEKFDIIICAFDTINHLKNIREWTSLFKSVKKNLVNGGLFLFDFNSIKGFEAYNNKIIFKEVGKDFLIMQTRKQGQRCVWTINIFKNKNKNMFTREEIVILERSYDNDLILGKIKEHFAKVKFIKNKDGSRIYVKAQK